MKVKFNVGGVEQTREYTREIHGEDYKKLAKEFVSHINGGQIIEDESEKIEDTVEGIDTEIEEGKTPQDAGEPADEVKPKTKSRPTGSKNAVK